MSVAALPSGEEPFCCYAFFTWVLRSECDLYLSLTSYRLVADGSLTIGVSIHLCVHVPRTCRTLPKKNMIKITRSFRLPLFTGLLLGVSAGSLLAQGFTDPADTNNPRRESPSSSLFAALDTNHDGVISPEEIAGASTALKSLLRNGATQLTSRNLDGPSPRAFHLGQMNHPVRPALGMATPPNPPPFDHPPVAPPTTADILAHPPAPPAFPVARQEREAGRRRSLEAAGYPQTTPFSIQANLARPDSLPRPQIGPDGQLIWLPSVPAAPARKFEAPGIDLREAVSNRQVSQALETLKQLERELHQLQEQSALISPEQSR